MMSFKKPVLIAAVLLVNCFSLTAQADDNKRADSDNFTLIHSAWLGGWQWGYVGAELNKGGYTYDAPDLPGHGADKTPAKDISLDSYVNTITEILDQKESKSILVGHSFGGVVASQVAQARPDKVKAIVYLCAFLLPDNTSFMDATQGVTTSEVLNNLVFSEDGTAVGIADSAMHGAVAADVPADTFNGVKPNLVLEPTQPLAAKLSLTEQGYGSIPKYYVECTNDKAIPIDIQRAMQSTQTIENTYSIDSSHAVVFSQPGKVAEALDDIAKRETVRQAVLKASTSWRAAFNSGSASGAAALYEDDAIMVAKPFGTFNGKAAIQAFWQDLVEKGFKDVQYIQPKLTVLDKRSARIESDWTMNNAGGVITNEHWVVNDEGNALLREDHFEVLK